jgi:hypothetical protein
MALGLWFAFAPLKKIFKKYSIIYHISIINSNLNNNNK